MIQCESYCNWLDWYDVFSGLVCFFFLFFRSSGVVKNYQAKSIHDFLPLGVVQKKMKSPMNGFVLHVNKNLENAIN